MLFKPLLIGLVGLAGAGKSTTAAHLEDQYAFIELAFADPIVDMIGALFAEADIDGAWMVERQLKELPTPLGVSYRRLAQTLGTGWGRGMLGADFWIRMLAHRLDRPHLVGENVVVSDVRFPNEAAFIRARGGVLVRVLRGADHPTSADESPHESESHALRLPVDHELLNHGSKATLHEQIDRLVDTITLDAIEAKQTHNEGRRWPDWRTAEPGKASEHDRSAEAPAEDQRAGTWPEPGATSQRPLLGTHALEPEAIAPSATQAGVACDSGDGNLPAHHCIKGANCTIRTGYCTACCS